MSNELQTKLDAILADKQTNLLPENLKKGISLLGVTGTLEQGSGNIDTLDEPKCHIFYSDEEAKTFTGYNPGDRAIVYKLFNAPFYPDFFDNVGFSLSNTAIDADEPASIRYITCNDTVILNAAVTMSDSVTFDFSGSKGTNTGTISIDITPNSCLISVSGVTLSAASAEYTSEDGLTYTLTSFTGNIVPTYPAMIFDNGMLECQNALLEKWSSMKILSKFLAVPGKRTIEKVYIYDVIDTSTDSYSNYSPTDGLYTIDHSKTIVRDEQILYSPSSKKYFLEDAKALCTKLGFNGSCVVIYTKNEDIVYINNTTGNYVVYDVTGAKVYALGNSGSLYKCVISSGEKTLVTPIKTDIQILPNGEPNYNSYDIMNDVTCTIGYYETDGVLDWNDTSTRITQTLESNYYNPLRITTNGYPSNTVGLVEESLSLYAKSSDIKSGYTAFVNGYIEGSFDGNISVEEETEINSVLDEIIGGA